MPCQTEECGGEERRGEREQTTTDRARRVGRLFSPRPLPTTQTEKAPTYLQPLLARLVHDAAHGHHGGVPADVGDVGAGVALRPCGQLRDVHVLRRLDVPHVDADVVGRRDPGGEEGLVHDAMSRGCRTLVGGEGVIQQANT